MESNKEPLGLNNDIFYSVVLNNLAAMDRTELYHFFKKRYAALLPVRVRYEKDVKLLNLLHKAEKSHYRLLRSRLAHLYFRIARLLGSRYFIADSKKERERFREIIITACSLAFEMRAPTAKELSFFLQWGEVQGGAAIDSDYLEFNLVLDLALEKIDEEAKGIDGADLEKEELSIRPLHTYSNSKEEQDKVEQLYQFLKNKPWQQTEASRLALRQEQQVEQELEEAYLTADYMRLLLLEIRLMSLVPCYLEELDAEKLRWFIVAIEWEWADDYEQDEELSEQLGYPTLMMYRMLEEEPDASKFGVIMDAVNFDEIVISLENAFDYMERYPSVERIQKMIHNLWTSIRM